MSRRSWAKMKWQKEGKKVVGKNEEVVPAC